MDKLLNGWTGFLSRCLAARDLSRSRIQVLLKDGLVTADGAPAKARITVTPGMEVTLTIPPSAQAEALPEDIPLAVLYEDTELIVINKSARNGCPPGGRQLRRNRGSMHSSTTAGTASPESVESNDRESCTVSTRTPGGCLVAAKNDHAHHALVSQFSSRTTRKVLPRGGGGACRLSHTDASPLTSPATPHNRLRMCTVSPPHGKEAITDYEVYRRA